MSEERLAPVIPLFGAASASGETPTPAKRGETTSGDESGEPSGRHPARGAHRGGSGGARHAHAGDDPGGARPSADAGSRPRLRALRPHDPNAADGMSAVDVPSAAVGPTGDARPGDGRADSADLPAGDPVRAREAAEEVLVRRLRGRSLSVAEAKTVLKGTGLESSLIEDVIAEFCRRGYLDDAILAGHLVTAGVERKGQGRVALGRVLAQRGIPRDVAEAALAELPDDDSERALEYARSKARSLARLDFDTALRRLVGQLSRRGYSGGVAMSAARTALTEASGGGSGGGVRFVDSE